MTVFLLEIPPGGKSAPQQHLFDEMFYVHLRHRQRRGRNARRRQAFVRMGSAQPVRAAAQCALSDLQASGREPVRLACANELRILMNLFHNEAFFFDNPFPFPEREGLALLRRCRRDDLDPAGP